MSLRGIAASMGPRRIRRGGRRPPVRCRAVGWGFNGATANSPWRTTSRLTPLGPPRRLQWGHGEFAVEEGRYRPRRQPGSPVVSMGPRRIRRGGPLACSITAAVAVLLQWGHGEFAVEDGESSRSFRYGYLLQWGHGEF